MASLKDLAAQAIGITGSFSMINDFFGYQYYNDQQTFVNPISLKKQMKLIKGKSVHLSVILVGKNSSFSDSVVTIEQVRDLQAGIQHMRDIYDKAPLGIRKIYWSRISVSDAGSYINITDSSEAEDLTDDWNGSNDGIDTFMVQSIGNAAGWSNSKGPCNKDSVCGLTGAVIEFRTNQEFFGVLLAHEIGHYLGLKGGNSTSNLMGNNNGSTGIDTIATGSTDINSSQASTMRSGCYVKNSL
jgi:hypothetical protein